jgi:predicted DCC family thiol-disulfide oxidoreductase YuxK
MTSAATSPWPDDDVILYDGVCIFCSCWVRFVATRDVVLRRLPKTFRDAVYSLVARNRFRIFGKYQECFVAFCGVGARVMG